MPSSRHLPAAEVEYDLDGHPPARQILLDLVVLELQALLGPVGGIVRAP
jgi:hypothetical protein